MRKCVFVLVAVLALATWVLPAPAAPPHPELLRQVRRGERPEPAFFRHLKELGPSPSGRRRSPLQALRGAGVPGPPAPRTTPTPPVTGSPKVLVLAVSFSDVSAQVAASSFDSLFFGASSPSVADYYAETSGGSLSLTTNDAPSSVGWLALPGTKATYNAQLSLANMASDAVAAADSLVDFSSYDNDGDGLVDYLVLAHVGTGGELTGSDDDIWSRTVRLSTPILTSDGVSVDTFSTLPEYWYSPGDMTIGIWAHEFGHLLGLVDLYDLDLDSLGIGDWGLMGHGAWNGPSTLAESPAWASAWSRIALGWETPVTPAANMENVTLAPVESGGPVYLLWNDGLPGAEYFLLENRQWLGYDDWLPDYGLLVWHVDETMPDNDAQVTSHNDCSWPEHYLVALQQADGYLNLEKNQNPGDAGDPYPGALSRTAFSLLTTPNSGSYSDCLSKVAVLDIQEVGDDIVADLQVDAPPSLSIHDYRSLEPLFPGTEIPFAVSLRNSGVEATGVTAVLESLDPLVGVVTGSASFPDIAFGASESNEAAPFTLLLDPAAEPGTLFDLSLTVDTDQGYQAILTLTAVAEPTGVMLVDDDRNSPADFSPLLLDPLDGLGRRPTHWDHLARGTPPLFLMEKHPQVAWTTGATFAQTLTAEEEDLAADYLEKGGAFMLSSQDYYYERGLTSFARTYFHLSGFQPDRYYTTVEGLAGDPVSDGLGPFTLSYPFNNRSDCVFTDGQASITLRAPGVNPAALKYRGAGFATSYSGFPLEALQADDRAEYLARLLPWLRPVAGDASGNGTADLLVIRPAVSSPLDVMVLGSTGRGFSEPVDRGDLDGGDDVLLRGDLTGDGLDDLARGILTPEGDLEWRAHTARWSRDGGLHLAFEPTGDPPWNAGLAAPESLFFLADVTGDARADLVYSLPDPAAPRSATWWISQSTGRYLLAPVQWSAGFGRLTRGVFLAGDVNGDGRADLVWGKSTRRWYVSLSTGSAFAERVLWTADAGMNGSRFMLGDVNGDGRADLVFSQPKRSNPRKLLWKVALSTGSSFAPESRWNSFFGRRRWQGYALRDLNGDGREDLVGWKEKDGTWRLRAVLSTGDAFSETALAADIPSVYGDTILP